MKRLAVVILAIVVLPASRAEALPTGWFYSAWNGFTVINDGSGNQWLPPIDSTNISYDDMVLELADSNSQYFGLRYATQPEVIAVFNAYGVTTFDAFSAALVGVANAYMADWGVTDMPNPFATTTLGLTSTSPGGSQQYLPQVLNDNSFGLALFGTTGNTNRSFASPTFGSYLIVDVPEPGVATLLAGAVVAFGLLRPGAARRRVG